MNYFTDLINQFSDCFNVKYTTKSEALPAVERLSIENMKRVITSSEGRDLKDILNFVEFKTVWHPIGM